MFIAGPRISIGSHEWHSGVELMYIYDASISVYKCWLAHVMLDYDARSSLAVFFSFTGFHLIMQFPPQD